MVHPCGDPPPQERRYYLVDEEGGRLPFDFRTEQQAHSFISSPELVENRLKSLRLVNREIEEVKLLQKQVADRERHLGYLRNLLIFPFRYEDFSTCEETEEKEETANA